MPRRKDTEATAPADPDALVRAAAGAYRTADDRFEVRQGDLGWFVVDTDQANEFGQELMHGPFATLKAARAAIAPARSDKVTPLRRPQRAGGGRGKTGPAKAPRTPPPTWIDRLPAADAREVRRLVTALEAAGIARAEDLVRRDREGLEPVVAQALIGLRLDALVDEVAPDADAPVRDMLATLVRRVAAALAAEGRPSGPLPGWGLVELGPLADPPNRRISLEP
jgi:hypothetical protein